MENGLSLLFAWGPILVLIVFWIAFARRLGEPQRRVMDRSVQFMERSEQLLERIAAALEQRNRSTR